MSMKSDSKYFVFSRGYYLTFSEKKGNIEVQEVTVFNVFFCNRFLCLALVLFVRLFVRPFVRFVFYFLLQMKPRESKLRNFHFNDVFSAMLTLYTSATGEGWPRQGRKLCELLPDFTACLLQKIGQYLYSVPKNVFSLQSISLFNGLPFMLLYSSSL